MKTQVLPLTHAIDWDLPRPADIELSIEELEVVVGGLERVWLPPAELPSRTAIEEP